MDIFGEFTEVMDDALEKTAAPETLDGPLTSPANFDGLSGLPAEARETEFAPSMEIQAQELALYFDETPELQFENWVNMDVNERMDALNALEKEAAAVAHRPAREVLAGNLGENVLGVCEGGANYDGTRIRISDALVSGGSYEAYKQSLETLLHEGRHAYQWYNMRGALYPDQAQVVEQNSVLVTSWLLNVEALGYDNGDRMIFKETGFYRYYTQPVEVDANTFAEAVMDKLGL